jgi:shikimate dehydrogenase
MSEDLLLPYAEVIGDPVIQSKSPLIHGFWLKQLGINARYGARRVTSETLEEYLCAGRTDPLWQGCNITMPLKQAVIPLLDHVDKQARSIGAVNTVYRDPDGALCGMNTDASGFLEPLAAMLGNRHLFRMARIIGTGGAARAIITALAAQGFTLVVISRNEAKARALLDELAPNAEHYTAPIEHFEAATDFAFDDRAGCLDLIVNASPLGMHGNPELLFDLSHAPPGSVFYDIVTSPAQTQILESARASGFATINGLSMLIGQAAIAFEKLFGRKAPREYDGLLQDMLRV